jgi:hypothetical protein
MYTALREERREEKRTSKIEVKKNKKEDNYSEQK